MTRLVCAAALFALACGGASAATQDVVSVVVHPYLEGKSPLVATRDPRLWHGPGTVISLASVENAIPEPLPAPLPQPTCRGLAFAITVVERGGEQLTYGPCAVPQSISSLVDAMRRVAMRNATRAPVVRVVLDPNPKGESPLVAIRAPRSWRGRGTVIPLRRVEKAIPYPLPLPRPHPNCRPRWSTLFVTTRGGHVFTYGACTLPEPLQRLKSLMIRVAAGS